MSAEPLELAAEAVRLATRAGADAAEATVAVSDRFSVETRAAVVTKLEQSVARSMTLRVFTRGAKATLSTNEFDPAHLESFVREAVAASRSVAPDEFGGLPDDADAASADLEIDFDDVRERAAEAKIDEALALERLTRAEDARIVNSGGSRVGTTSIRIALANSRGFASSYRATGVSRGSSPIAHDGETKRIGSYGTAARSFADLDDVAEVARIAARRATQLIGARKPETMTVPVIFDRDVAGAVLGDVFSAVAASSVSTGNSFLIDRVGDRIGSDLVTIVDDGRRPRALGTSPFDAEGVPTRRTVVFERGTLRTYLYDTYYARKLGAASTGNASGSSVGPNSFSLEPGTTSVADAIRATKRGVFVTDTIGFSTENVTGTYSRGARGFLIENGELAYPIDGFTIASDLVRMLAGVDVVCDDLVFDGTIVAPTFRVAEMTISGS